MSELSTETLKAIKSNQLYKLGAIKVGTPESAIEWAHLGVPQTGNPEYDGEYGKYRFDFLIDPLTTEGKLLVEKLEQAHDTLIARAQAWAAATKTKIKFVEEVNIRKQTRKEGDEKIETGKLVIKFAQHAARLDKKTEEVIPTPVVVVDTAGNPVPRAILNSIGNGTTVQVAFDLSPYYMNGSIGTTVKLKKTRLVKLSRYGDDINDDDYFDEIITSGFVVDESTSAAADDFNSDEVNSTDGDF